MPFGIERNDLLQLGDELRTFGPGTDQTHFTAADIDELRQLIEPRLANQLTDAGDPRITLLRPDGAVLLRIDPHRTELDDLERHAVQPDSFLRVENRPS